MTGYDAHSSSELTLRECLRAFSGLDAFLTPLRASPRSSGSISLRGPLEQELAEEPRRREFVARWRQVESTCPQRTYALVVLEEPTEIENLVSVINAQQVRINQLLIRQTLIEEKERRRIGRAMHDSVAQELAHIHAQIVHKRPAEDDAQRLADQLDAVIQSVREFAFELSPPILEDLGIQPALRWLAEHLGRRHGTQIEVADDVTEPELSPTVRTIIFRAVRELAINAAKYAGDAEIILSCLTGSHTVRFGVRDTGPGFEPVALGHCTTGVHRFGLLSVEQQIRGIGGTFEIVSSIGEGTRATITVPLEPQGSAAHG